jgi:hypothetical protein
MIALLYPRHMVVFSDRICLAQVELEPSLERVEVVVGFLQERCGLQPNDLPALMQKFPQILGCDESQLTEAINVLENTWKIKNNVLVSLLKRNPNVLGYNVDCAMTTGSCSGDCERCWQRF